MLATGLACAQLPGTLNGQGSATKASVQPGAPESTEQARARVRKLLEAAHADSERAPGPVPAGVPATDVEILRDSHLRLVAAYDIQLRALEQTAETAAARKTAEARARDWTGFETPPPYSILRVDQLREAAALAGERVKVLDATLAQIRHDSERLQQDLKRAESDARRAEESFESATLPEDKARWAWQRTEATVRARASAASLSAASLFTSTRTDASAASRAELELLRRQIALAERGANFSEADLAAARKRLDERTAAARHELAAVEVQIGIRLRASEAAAEALARERARTNATAAERAAAEARLESSRTLVSARREQSDALRGLMLLNELMSTLWEARYMAFHDDAANKWVAQTKLREAARQIVNRNINVENLARESRARLADAETRVADASVTPASLRFAHDALTARREALLTSERLQNAIEADSRQLGIWITELDAARLERDARTRVRDAWITLRAAAESVWNFELFAAEDTHIVDGQTVTISRGVTVGKSIGAVLFFLLGLLAMGALARGIEHRLVARGVDAARARTGKRWILALSAVLLLLLTLNIAKIPVTVFAFLGGALAIGAGFGIQTLIKNLASGVVMMAERLIKVGDIVEVEGVSGTITEVNLRSSTVLAFDGTESIIPNSVFVENKVTNWTGSNRKVRRVVKVGVAYGSPVREVADLLAECAQRHGLVLKEPAPLVIFEDFGDSALVFALYVWLELQPNMSSLQVMSDLRFMIDKQFAEAGISIAYPQRDLHIDAARPLRIELVRDGEARLPGSPASPPDTPGATAD